MQGTGTNKKIFDQLNATQHLVYEGKLFTGAPVAEYWMLSDLLPIFDLNTKDAYTYKSQFTLHELFYNYTPKKTKPKNSDKMEQLLGNNITVTNKENDFDTRLSRYMCWALAKEIGKHQSTEFHQEYFICPNQKFEIIHQNAREVARIALREKEKEYYKQLSGIMSKLHINYSALTSEINTWFFNGLSANDIKTNLNDKIAKINNTTDTENIQPIKQTSPLVEYMNDRLLDAYIRLLKAIVERYDSEPRAKTAKKLHTIAYNESIHARWNFMFGTPEGNFEITPIKTIKQKRKEHELAFAQKYINSNTK